MGSIDIKMKMNAYIGNLFKYILLPLLVINNLHFFFTPEADHASMIDLKNIYTAIQVYSRGENPYNDTHIQSGWEEISEREDIARTPGPGLPDNPFLYPPSVLTLFYPIGSLSFTAASNLWFAVLTLAGIGILILLASLGGYLNSWKEWILLILMFLAMKGQNLGLIVGNPLFISYMCGLLSVWLDRKGYSTWAGLVLSIAFLKYTLVFPFFLYFLARKNVRVLVVSILLVVITNLVFLLKGHFFWIASYMDMVSLVTESGQCYDYSPAYHEFQHVTVIQTVLYYLTRSRGLTAVLAFATAIISIVYFYRKNRIFTESAEKWLVFFTFFSLLFVQHRYIDYLIFFNIFLFIRPRDFLRLLGWRVVFILPYMLPIFGDLTLALGIHLPDIVQYLLLLDMQITTVIVFTWWLWKGSEGNSILNIRAES